MIEQRSTEVIQQYMRQAALKDATLALTVGSHLMVPNQIASPSAKPLPVELTEESGEEEDDHQEDDDHPMDRKELQRHAMSTVPNSNIIQATQSMPTRARVVMPKK